jgi:hypothetical protein
MTPTNDKLPSLARYCRIMGVVAGFPDGLSLDELAKLLALPKASTHRLLAMMQKSQLVATRGVADRARRLQARRRPHQPWRAGSAWGCASRRTLSSACSNRLCRKSPWSLLGVPVS